MTDEPFALPMFPLGSVLFPLGPLPLHIFETRYQQLLNHALESDRHFGVVLITRGSEVGGGDLRCNVGTIAHIEDYQRFDDGRAAVVCVGTRRIEVVEWLDDDPYPRALVAERKGPEVAGDGDRRWLDTARASLSAVLALAARQGRIASTPTFDWLDDIDDASWQLAGIAPLSALDQYSVLEAPTRAARLERLDTLLRELHNDLELLGPVR